MRFMADLNELWTAVTDELTDRVPVRERAYLRLTRLHAIVEDTALLSVPDAFTRDVIESRLRPEIVDALANHLDRRIQIAVTVQSSAQPATPEPEPMVTRGVRLPVTLDARLREAADQAGVPFSQLIREWIELGLTEMNDERQISLATLRRAIAHAAQTT
ncbi:chromosomal replication initiator protein dnaa [Actinoplanes friuliensis DSM 7358]|uniref:Chromosomal replication initiator protein dnaa n=1 Tax=Actinoplanes friuliensis DSM 7358 TaxID=1246995 RepID=U5W0D5_9ACTN|nr:chromosomal replication initiator protein dnaa [Actinoplanes friuliensis DSM 7358]